jgi:hypothetical protein
MTPQSSFMVVARIDESKLVSLRDLLASMNVAPGEVNRDNPVVPFGRLETLHFARIVILADQTTGDCAVYNLPKRDYPLLLAFLGDFDGGYDEFLRDLEAQAGAGLRRIFSHCAGFTADTDLNRWMREREHRPSTYYANTRGRTVRQCREEAKLRQVLAGFFQRAADLAGCSPLEIRDKLCHFVAAEKVAGRIQLTPEAATPFQWTLRNALHFFLVPLILLAALPFLLIYSPFFLYQLRSREKSDPEVIPRPDPHHVARLAALEDHGVTNQFSAMGSLKPGVFRRWTLTFLLWIVEYTTRHVYVAGRLARVHTIHFARWVFIDNKQRLFFASNYDGSLESYMDDFINKVAFGLNVVFSNGIGYPVTNWLILDGAKNEQAFKYFIRRHELPTEVWYNAHAGMTNSDLERNSRIRKGIEAASMTEEEARAWVALL